MKYIYFDSHLSTLLLDVTVFEKPRTWLYSQGKAWLLLTPDRLESLAEQAGRDDERIRTIIRLVRRHGKDPGAFCHRLGIHKVRYYSPEQYPSVLCPRCDGLHYPHPEDAMKICGDCQNQQMEQRRRAPAGGQVQDRRRDILARERLLESEPSSFFNGEFAPNHHYNVNRRIHRDWDSAINQILMGQQYRQVAERFHCSVGLLHKIVTERPWENN